MEINNKCDFYGNPYTIGDMVYNVYKPWFYGKVQSIRAFEIPNKETGEKDIKYFTYAKDKQGQYLDFATDSFSLTPPDEFIKLIAKFSEFGKIHFDLESITELKTRMKLILLNEDLIENIGTPIWVKDKSFAVSGEVSDFQTAKELKEFIRTNNGFVHETVTKDTDFIITDHTDDDTAKNIAARKFGTPILGSSFFATLTGYKQAGYDIKAFVLKYPESLNHKSHL